MSKYRKKQIEVEAFKLTYEVAKGEEQVPEWAINAHNKGILKISYTSKISNSQYAEIKTLKGTMVANAGDFIIQGADGELYPCKHDVFNKTYEPVQDKTSH